MAGFFCVFQKNRKKDPKGWVKQAEDAPLQPRPYGWDSILGELYERSRGWVSGCVRVGTKELERHVYFQWREQWSRFIFLLFWSRLMFPKRNQSLISQLLRIHLKYFHNFSFASVLAPTTNALRHQKKQIIPGQ